MGTQSRRLFVGNLPHAVTQNELVKKFQRYGKVESAEIKTKKDPTSDEVISTFSYINIQSDDDSLRKCINHLNGMKWDGCHVKVEVAKESFLQRLMRERQSSSANQQSSVNHHPAQPQPQKSVDTVVKPLERQSGFARKKFNARKYESSSESSDSEGDGDKFHPTNKLQKFKGIASVAVSESLPSSNTDIDNKASSKFSLRGTPNSTGGRISKPQRQKESSNFDAKSDVLKQFELFSDVWKDSDEPSYRADTRKHKFTSETKLGKGKQSQNFERGERNGFVQESNTAPSIKSAEEKRLMSIEERRRAFEQQKKAVQLALSDTKAQPMNNKIVFDDDDEDDESGRNHATIQKKTARDLQNENAQQNLGKKKTALNLFTESDDESVSGDWNSEFQVKKQFEGKKGKKLLELQTRYNNDQRFKLDERFIDSDDEDRSRESTKTGLESGQEEGGIEGLAEERAKQLEILSSVIGQSIPISHAPANQESKNKGMLRFDPLKPNHSRYELTREPKERKKKKKDRPDSNENEIIEEDEEEIKKKVRREEKEPEPVSQNKFYSVSDSLAESLKLAKEGQGSGFSLLQMFGSPSPATENNSKNEYKELATNKKGQKSHAFMDESSSEDEENPVKGPTAFAEYERVQQLESASGKRNVKAVNGVWQESFFFQSDDSRLREGAEFTSQTNTSEDSQAFAQKRRLLRHVVKIKIRSNTRKANAFRNRINTLRKLPFKRPTFSKRAQNSQRKSRK